MLQTSPRKPSKKAKWSKALVAPKVTVDYYSARRSAGHDRASNGLQPIICTQYAVNTNYVEPLYITATKDDYEIHFVLIDGEAGPGDGQYESVGIDPASS